MNFVPVSKSGEMGMHRQETIVSVGTRCSHARRRRAVRTTSGGSRETVEAGTGTGDSDDLEKTPVRSLCRFGGAHAWALRLVDTHVKVLGTRVVSAVHDSSNGESQSHAELVSGRSSTSTSGGHCLLKGG